MPSSGSGYHDPRRSDYSAGPERHPSHEGGSSGQDHGEWFLADPDPLLVVDPAGTLIDANPAGRRLLEAGGAVSRRQGRVMFAEIEAQLAFTRGLTDATRQGAARAIVRGNDGQWRPLELLASPTRPRDLIFVSFCGEPLPLIEVDGLIGAFGLTVAEGEVLRLLTAGLLPKDVARQLGVSTNTVRAHLRTLYLKMHVRGIAGVIRQVLRLVR